MRGLIPITGILLASAFPTPANACSMIEGYQVPTTMELVHQSRAIVLARVTESIPRKSDIGLGEIILKPEVLIAGATLPSELRISGQFGSDRYKPTRSNPNELAQANPDAFAGACNRYIFDPGMLLLLFLDQDPAGRYRVIDASFARTLEDVPNANSLWVRAVRYYAEVARLPKSEQKAAMRAEIKRLQATGASDDALLAADIARQIKKRRTQNYD